MNVEYNFPGTIKINLDRQDLLSLQQQGFTVERAGFSGPESKTWIHLPPIEPGVQNRAQNTAEIEPGGDLHVRLFRGFLPPVVIEQEAVENINRDIVQHYLGTLGVVIVDI